MSDEMTPADEFIGGFTPLGGRKPTRDDYLLARGAANAIDGALRSAMRLDTYEDVIGTLDVFRGITKCIADDMEAAL